MDVKIEKCSDGSYLAYNTEEEAKTRLIGTGATVAEAKADFYNSIEEIREISDDDSELTEPVFHFDISSLFEYYNVINMAGFAKYAGINATLLRQYKKGDTYISDKRLREIEDAIHRLGAELSALKLT